MQVVVKATKMVKAEAHKVSLVKRAATRIPFRIVKSDKNSEESGMIDLAKVFKREATVPAKPQAVAVVVQKADASDELKDQLIQAGFEVGEVKDNGDDTLSYILKGESIENEDELDVVRQSDDMLVVLKNFRPYSDALTDFAEVAQARGFYSGICTAGTILSDTINQLMYDADSPDDAATKVGELIDAYKKYVVGMASALPALAFKTDTVVKAEKEKKMKEKGKVPAASTEVANSQASAENAENTSQVTKGEGEGEGGGAAPVVETEKPAVTEPESPAPAAEAAQADTGQEMVQVLKGELDKIVQSLESVRNEITELRTEQKNLQGSVAEAVSKSEKLERDLAGSLLSSPPAEDQPANGCTRVEKHEWKPLGDTAFEQRSKRFR